MSTTKASLPMLNTTDSPQEAEMGKKLQVKCHSIVSSESPAKLYCCYGVIIVLTATVVVLSVALSVKRTEQISIKNNAYAAYPGKWIGFGNKWFYFSEYPSNWTFSQNFCMSHGAQLARIDSLEELNVLRRYKGIFDHWIGLYRESSEHPWKWTDNTEYNNLVPIQGVEGYVYLNSQGFSSARVYKKHRWICSKLNTFSLHC